MVAKETAGIVMIDEGKGRLVGEALVHGNDRGHHLWWYEDTTTIIMHYNYKGLPRNPAEILSSGR